MACKFLHVVNTVTPNLTSSTLLLNFVSTATASDEDKFCIKLATTIDDIYAAYTVLLTVNGTSTVALLDKYGNPVTASDLQKGRLYRGFYGATTPHVILTNLPLSYSCGCQ